MNGVNLRRFEFDYDTTWNSFFLDEKLNVYSRYGGRDGGEPEARMSKKSLLQTMREVLAVHANRNKPVEKNSLPRTQPVASGTFRPHDIPLLKQNHQGCVHCHQVREYQLLQSFKDGKFRRDFLFNWPLPENLGILFDRSHGHRIDKILPNSSAQKAGLRKGDVILGVNRIPIHSEYDVRWALGRAPNRKPLAITIRRMQSNGQTSQQTLSLKPKANWRDTPLGWRKSLRSIPMPFGFRGYSLTRSQRRDLKLKESQLAIRVVSARSSGLAGNLSLKRKDTIIELDGESINRTLEQLKSDIIQKYRPGDLVRMTVLREGKAVRLQGKLPDWHTEETSAP